MRNLVLAALLAGTVVATPAFAQNAAPDASGLRIEGIVGYDRGNVDDENSEGVVYGLGVGYDMQAGRAVFGIEAEATDSSADACARAVVVAGDTLCARARRDLYIGGRVGALVGPRTLLYGKLGYTNARVGLTYEDGTAATAADFDVSENLDGVRAGAGLQFGLGANTYLKTEYRYSNYQDGFDRHQVVGGFGVRF